MKRSIKASITSVLVAGGIFTLVWQHYHDTSFSAVATAPAEFLKPATTSKPALTRPASFFLNTIPKAAVPTLSAVDWKRAYPLFSHAPFENAGFNAVSLPWKYKAENDAQADPAVADALAFLLSFDLDWAAESYNTRHAYFVFKHTQNLMEVPERAYDARSVVAMVGGWGATHAIGGALTRTKDGYAATLQIFDGSGKIVHEKAFDEPREFFQLMGDVSCDALSFFKSPANLALTTYLHRQRCALPESLSKLGRSASTEWRSPEEFAVYADILAKDPGFSEVRQWRANQQYWWTNGSARAYADDQATALKGAVHPNALVDFNPEACTQADVGALLPQWIDRAEALAGPNHPVVIAWRLRLAANRPAKPRQSSSLISEEFAPYVKAASRNPNDKTLLLDLLSAMEESDEHRTIAPFDPELFGSVAVTYVQSRTLPPNGFGSGWCRLAHAAHMLGRQLHVMEASRRERKEPPTGVGQRPCHLWAAEAEMDLGDFQGAADSLIEQLPDIRSFPRREELLDEAAVCAVLADRADLLDTLSGMTNRTTGGANDFIAACKKYLEGRPVDRTDFPATTELDLDLILLAEAELAQGGDFSQPSRNQLWVALKDWPLDLAHWRLKWILLERYFRLQPTLSNLAGFYEATQWLFPDDPYVASAAAASKARGASPALPTANQIIANLSNPQSVATNPIPLWTAIARIQLDLKENRVADAKRLLAAMKLRTPGAGLMRWLENRINETAQP